MSDYIKDNNNYMHNVIYDDKRTKQSLMNVYFLKTLVEKLRREHYGLSYILSDPTRKKDMSLSKSIVLDTIEKTHFDGKIFKLSDSNVDVDWGDSFGI